MPTPNRKSTGKAAPKTGAASAVPADSEKTVTSETPITVDAATPPSDDKREQLRALAADDQAAARAAGQLEVPPTEGIPAAAAAATVADVQHESTPKVTEGVEGQVGAVEDPVVTAVNVPDKDGTARATASPAAADDEAPARDLTALRRLADTSGDDLVTPYPADGVIAPNPVQVLPELKTSYTWSAEGDTTLTARVLADGWRCLVNKQYQFARRGDRITAPADVIKAAAKHGIVIIEE